MKKKTCYSTIIVCIALFLIIGVTHSIAGNSMVLQIHPYLPPDDLIRRFSPLVEYLKRETGKKIICNISKNYDDHIKAIGRDIPDIAFIGPASYVTIVKIYGKKPLLARLEINGSPTFRGVIITRTDSDIGSITDLKNRKFAFGDPNSTMSHLIPMYMIKKAGLDKSSLSGYEFLKGHKNVALGVLMGDFDAGAVKEEVFFQYKARGLRAVAWTPRVSEHVFVARSSMNPNTVTALRNLLLSLNKKRDGKYILSSIKDTATALVPVRDEDYDNLRKILSYIAEINLIKK